MNKINRSNTSNVNKNSKNSRLNLTTLIALFSLTLTACGGSSSTNPVQTITPVTPVVLTENTIIALDNNLASQQAVELVLFDPDETVSNINWQQTSGSPVTFLAKNSKVIAFTPVSAGDYSFSVDFNVNGNAKNLTKTITVSNENHLISARLGHAALAGNKVSLRAWLDDSLTNSSVTWQQIAGPSVSLTNYKNGDLAIFFTAPNVEKDTVLQFSVQASNGSSSYSDSVAVLIEKASTINSNAYFENRVAQVFPYDQSGTYASALIDCIYNNTISSSCTLAKLPLIAQQTSTPTVDDIMSRVVVSHQWMGDRFKEFLQQYDTNNDFKNLLRATTGIVISYDVRPSFYWAATGAIYLDANNFWLTPDERDTINEAPDYRADFGNDLQFVMPWRYVKNNDYASSYVPSTVRTTRQGQDGLYRLSSLLFHELAHANDFFPSSEWLTHSSDTRVLDAALASDFESDALALSYPLQDQNMRNLAQVSFAGETANDAQKAYLPSDITGFFSVDSASDFYSYSSLREDYAMLFEETMMYSRFNIQRDVAITNQPTAEVVYANDYIVNWGQRGRVGESNIKPRANFVLQRVLPELNNTNIINALPQPAAMIAGNNWIENLSLTTSAKTATNTAKSHKAKLVPMIQQNYYHKELPKH
jgi:hypothetical protein